MKKIFLESGPYQIDDEVIVEGEDCFHLTKVLRVRSGESFIIGDNSGAEFKGVVEKVEKRSLTLRLKEQLVTQKDETGRVTLFFSLLKGSKNDEIIRRGSEIGIDRFVPVITANTVVELDRKAAKKRHERWLKIAREAAMQCGRRQIATIDEVILLKDMELPGGIKLLAYADSVVHLKDSLPELKGSKSIALFTGPEGDFSPDEVDSLTGRGWKAVRIADNILRSETAAIYFSSIITFFINA